MSRAKQRPWRSGFCGLTNPADSHGRCVGSIVNLGETRLCCCDCHTDPSPAPDGVVPSEADPVGEGPVSQPVSSVARSDQPSAGEALPALADDSPRLGVYDGLDELAYHSDPTSVSASGMKALLRSPAHFQHARTHPKTSNAMELGTIAHTLVLGTGQEYVAIEGNRNANAVKEKIAEAEAAGLLVLKPEQLQAAERMADAVLTHPKASRLLTSPGRSELSMFWRDPAYDVIRRCRWDRLGDDGIGVDLKTGRTADPRALPKAIVDWGYDLSAQWYLEVADGCGVPIEEYWLVFVENTEPHAVTVVELDPRFLDRGYALGQQALATYRRCLDTGVWPGYVPDDEHITISPPAWAPTYSDQPTALIPDDFEWSPTQ